MFLPIFSTEKENYLRPTRQVFLLIPIKKSFCWLTSFFRFGTENGKEKLKTDWRKIGEKKQNICFWKWVSEKHWRKKIICQMRRRRKTPRIWFVHKSQHCVRNKCMNRFNMRVTSFSVGIKCLTKFGNQPKNLIILNQGYKIRSI